MEDPEEICKNECRCEIMIRKKRQGTYDNGELVMSSTSFEVAIGERNKIK